MKRRAGGARFTRIGRDKQVNGCDTLRVPRTATTTSPTDTPMRHATARPLSHRHARTASSIARAACSAAAHACASSSAVSVPPPPQSAPGPTRGAR